MNSNDVLLQLEALGTEQNRKVYARHGVRNPVFGVSYAALDKLRKQLGTDDLMAVELWASGNHDARMLATKLADPAATKRARVEAWASDLDNYVLTDALAALAARSPDAATLRAKLAPSKGEWTSTLGWMLLAIASADRDAEIDDELLAALDVIERDIHARPNRTRHAMNSALIGIGCRGGALTRRANAVAKAIGTVEVDHGETGCKTPDAAAYIERTRAHLDQKSAPKGKQARAPAKAKAKPARAKRT